MLPEETTALAGAESDALWLQRWQARAWRRWRTALAAEAVLWGGTVGLVLAAATGGWRVAGAAAALTAGVRMFGSRAWHDVSVMLSRAELEAPALRNALLTWHETVVAGLQVPDVFRARLAMQARTGLAGQRGPAARARRAWLAAAGALLAAGGLFAFSLSNGPLLARTHVLDVARRGPTEPHSAAGGALSLHLHVTPPSYLERAEESYENPVAVDVIEGSLVTVSYAGLDDDALAFRGESRLALTSTDGRRTASFRVETSTVLLASAPDGTPVHAATIRTVPDSVPNLRVETPGRDLRPTRTETPIGVAIVAQDDHGLRDLRLRYTTVSGSGETFTFTDGELPVALVRESTTTWRATATIHPATLGLGPGDSLVYYAVAHDGRAGDAGRGESDRYLVEIARPGELGGGDFSLPDDEERYALSQRMVILLTERLLARRKALDVDTFVREAQDLAIQQRRVRAEFVFLMGGDVVDEVEEAEHSHEIEAGRLDNSGQQDLLVAVRQMSLAEQRLVAGDVAAALPFEYRALEALQAAFGRARYFMRTLPSRVAIDPDRRLSGDRDRAAPATWARQPLTPHDREVAVRLLGELRGLSTDGSGDTLRRVGGALLALDTASAEWQDAVGRLMVALTQAPGPAARAEAVDDLAGLLHARVVATGPARLPIRLPLGRLDADEADGSRSPR